MKWKKQQKRTKKIYILKLFALLICQIVIYCNEDEKKSNYKNAEFYKKNINNNIYKID
jgi:hypothetical protein